MIARSILIATVGGVVVLVSAQVLYIGVLIRVPFHEQLRSTLLIFPCLAAFAAAYLAPRRKLLTGMSMTVVGAFIGLVSSAIYQRLGFHVDRIGTLPATALILIVYYGLLSLAGSVGGMCMSRYSASRRRASDASPK